MFVDGSGFEGFYSTRNGFVLVQSEVIIDGEHLLLRGLSFYPATSAPFHLSVGEGTSIFHAILEEARAQGFATIGIEAFRTGGRRPGRMLELTRRLR